MIANLDRIHPLKRESCVRHCTEDSDIDIWLYSTYTCKNENYYKFFGDFAAILDDKSDILQGNLISATLLNTVEKNGVLVYQYQNWLTDIDKSEK